MCIRDSLAYLRSEGNETILIVANLSRFAQYAELDLSRFKGRQPMELFGRSRLPAVGDHPYPLPLAPHQFFWFSLEEPKTILTGERHETPQIQVRGTNWEQVLTGDARTSLEHALEGYIRARRWFGGKARNPTHLRIEENVRIPVGEGAAHLVMARLDYETGDPETYVVPLAYAEGDEAARLIADNPLAVVAALQLRGKPTGGVLLDALHSRAFNATLLETIMEQRRFKTTLGTLRGVAGRPLAMLHEGSANPPDGVVVRADQSNTSVAYDQKYFLKLYRKSDAGINPDLEVGRFLTERTQFANIAPVLGAIEFVREHGEPVTVASLLGFVPSHGDAWGLTLDALSSFLERALAQRAEVERLPPVVNPYAGLLAPPAGGLMETLVGPYSTLAQVLGQRTAEMHLALASDHDDPHFAPEPFSALYQRSIYQSMRNTTMRALHLLRKKLKEFPADVQAEAHTLLANEARLMHRFHEVIASPMHSMRIRVHGDFHLGQVLFTGRDFVIIDFEGEPARSLSERRIKRSPLRDVAGMLRSFSYASHAAVLKQTRRGVLPEGLTEEEHAWTNHWFRHVSAQFLETYLKTLGTTGLVPQDEGQLKVLLNAMLLEKAAYELSYELNHRPDWVKIPVRGILQLAGVDQ